MPVYSCTAAFVCIYVFLIARLRDWCTGRCVILSADGILPPLSALVCLVGTSVAPGLTCDCELWLYSGLHLLRNLLTYVSECSGFLRSGCISHSVLSAPC